MSAYQPSPVPGFQPTPEQHHHEPYRPDHSSPDSYKEHDQAPYYAEQNPGLEVVPPSGPEWVAGGAENTSGKILATDEELNKSGDKDHPLAGRANTTNEGTTQPWYKRKLILGIIAAVVVVAIALGVGLGVGLSSSKDKDSSKDDDGKGYVHHHRPPPPT